MRTEELLRQDIRRVPVVVLTTLEIGPDHTRQDERVGHLARVVQRGIQLVDHALVIAEPVVADELIDVLEFCETLADLFGVSSSVNSSVSGSPIAIQ